MARFTRKTKDIDAVTNYEGGKAFRLTPEMELYSAVCTASLQDKFYEKNDVFIKRLRQLVQKVDPRFIAQLAIYAREQMYLRSVPLVLVVELAKVHKGDNLVGRTTERIIQRADEIKEIFAYYQEANERIGIKRLNKLSKQIQKGISRAFLKFDEYGFSKYAQRSASKEITFKDILFLTHPKGNDELFRKIADDTLEVPYTWEVLLSEAPKLGKSKKDTWEELIDSGKMGIMATIRNLRNCLEARVSTAHIQRIAGFICSEKTILNSKLFPFRFFSAYRELVDVSSFSSSLILDALKKAIQISIQNVAGFDANTNVVIACDMSGSMQTPISMRSKIMRFNVGLVLGMLLQHRCQSVITGIFGERWKVISLPKTNVLENAMHLDRRIGEVGHSTNGYLAVKYLLDNGLKADKVMFFTDCQLWDSDHWGEPYSNLCDFWRRYRSQINRDAKLYIFDLAGYGTVPVNVLRNENAYLISGWNEKVFSVMENLEKGEDSLSEIRKITI